jgi:predicted RNA-binding Zn-ribbon protein involved in translation (DUF1610 family)
MPVSRECVKCNSEIPIVEKAADHIEIPHHCPTCSEKIPKRDGGPRQKKGITGHVTYEGKRKEFVTVDVSKGGVKAFYIGKPFPVGATVEVDVWDTGLVGRKAVVVWSHKSAATYSHSGLKFT